MIGTVALWCLLIIGSRQVDAASNDILDGFNVGIVYQYDLTSENNLIDEWESERVKSYESSAVVFFQILRMDQSAKKRFASFWVASCNNMECVQDSDGRPVKLFTIWHGSNLLKVLSPKVSNSKWDILRAVLWQFQYQLDTSKLNKVGLCEEKFGETPKSRTLRFCSSIKQKTFLGKVSEFTSEFNQSSQYFFDASAKLRQLLVQERHGLTWPAYPNVRSTFASKTKLTLADQSQAAVLNQQGEIDFDTYVTVVTKENNLQLISDSIETSFIAAHASDKKSNNDQKSTDSCSAIGGLKKLAKLKSGNSKASILKKSIGIFRGLRSMTSAQIFDCLRVLNDKSAEVAKNLLNILAVLGDQTAQKAALEFFGSISGQKSIEMRQLYLTALAHNLHATSFAEDVLNHFSKSIENSKQMDEHALLALSALARRSGIDRLQDKMFDILLSLMKNCQSESCQMMILRSLRNLGSQKTPSMVEQFLCSAHNDIGREALEALAETPIQHWSEKIIDLLVQVYQNRCATGQVDSTSRTKAAELLLRLPFDADWSNRVGTALLSPMTNGSDWLRKRERDVYAYAFAKLRQVAESDVEHRNIIDRAINKITGNNYGYLASNAMSTANKGLAADFGFSLASYSLDMEFWSGVVKRSTVGIQLDKKDGDLLHLISFALFSRGLDSMAGGGDSFSQEAAEAEDSSAGMRLALFNVLRPPVTFFSSQSELLSAVFSLSSDPATAFDDQFLFHDLIGRYPLSNGLTLNLDIQSVLGWKMAGSVDLSVWYRTSHSVVTNELAFLMTGSVTLDSGTKTDSKSSILRESLSLSAGFTVDFVTDVDFSQMPFSLCLQMNQEPAVIKYIKRQKSTADQKNSKKEWVRTQTRRIPGRCFVTDPNLARTCGPILQSLGRE